MHGRANGHDHLHHADARNIDGHVGDYDVDDDDDHHRHRQFYVSAREPVRYYIY